MQDDGQARLDAAIAAISDPRRLARAQDVVARVAPGLQGVLASALAEGGWFDTAHSAALREAVVMTDPGDRMRVIEGLLAEETRLSMLVGVAVGFELAGELGYVPETEPDQED